MYGQYGVYLWMASAQAPSEQHLATLKDRPSKKTKVNRDHREKDGLKDTRVNLPEGRRSVIIGPTGYGKTSQLRCLAGIYPQDKGHFSIGRQGPRVMADETRGGIVLAANDLPRSANRTGIGAFRA